MGNPQVNLDGNDLDNGSWRRIVDWPSFISNDDGTMEKFAIEFVIMGDTAAQMDDRFASTYEDFTKAAPRAKIWLDDAKATPTRDWYVGDGKHVDMISVISGLPEVSRTQKKQHFVFIISAYTELPLASGSNPTTELGSTIQGLNTTLEVAKDYMSSEKYTLTTGGQFVSTLNESAEGPYDIDSIANNSGKIRITLEAPDVVVASYDEGMFIDVTGTTDGLYDGRHFITAIPATNILDLDTDYVSAQGNVGATLLVGTTTTAEDNFASGKSQILVNLLETGASGQPGATAPHMALVKHTVSFTSERKDALEFVLVSAPQPIVTSVAASGGGLVERGLNYAVKYLPSADWNAGFVSAPVQMMVTGRVSILDSALTEKPLDQWWDEIELQIRGEIDTVSRARLGGSTRHQNTNVTVDHVTNEVVFDMSLVGNYNGTLAYSRSETTNDQKQRSGWELVEGGDYIQESKSAPRRMKTITISWVGDMGGEPGDPSPPTESGYTYLFDSSSVVEQEELTDEGGNQYSRVSKEFHFTRWKLDQASGGGGGSSGGSSSQGQTGGNFGQAAARLGGGGALFK